LKDAEDLAHRFNLKLDNIDITNLVDAFVNERGQLGLIRKGNVMARARMIALFDAAAEHKALVLGTGNKTEILLGYTTWYGDCACSLNPIGDLYKTQVWALSAHLELPENIIAKVPSADLWTDQTDEGELGILYETADQILYHLIDRRLKIKQVVDLGFEEQAVKMVAERVKRFHFKRVVPPIAKLSPRTVGKDFLYSRDWGV
jgi:NAD+ synthase